jgi:peptidoglycan/xylan/chitin deacetylase (PgdA/CDA1 family)
MTPSPSRTMAAVAALLLVAASSSCRSRTAEGVASPPQIATTAAPVATTAEVAVTVDDLPTHGPDTPGMDRMAITERFLAAFQRHGLHSVYGFVNGKRVTDVPASISILRRWRQAGHPLGNHTYSHVSLNAVGLSEYFADLERGEAVLKEVEPDAGVWKVFRYPFLFEGDTSEKREGVRRYLREHGYVMAPVTIDADDWAFNAPFSRCTAQNDAVSLAKLRGIFVETHTEELRRMQELSQTLMNRKVRQVLLLHIGAADADYIEDLLTAYERQGVTWIDLRTALVDTMYGLDPSDVVRYGAALPYRLAKARGIQVGKPVFARDLEDELARTCPAK